MFIISLYDNQDKYYAAQFGMFHFVITNKTVDSEHNYAAQYAYKILFLTIFKESMKM